MLDCKSFDEIIKILDESEYGYKNQENITPNDYEKLLRMEHKKVYELLNELTHESRVFDIFLQINDYHNVKVILKAEFLNRNDFDDILIESSYISTNQLKILIKDRKFSELPEIMGNAIKECLEVFNKTYDPQVIDVILDKAVFTQIKQMVDNIQNEFLAEFFETLVDLTNIKIFLRIRKLKKPVDYLKKLLIENGTIAIKEFIDKAELPMESFIDVLRYGKYRELIENGVENFKITGNITLLEKFSDDYLISFIKKSKYLSSGIEPLISYLIAKEHELKNVKIIIVGKINNISNEIIKERLRISYV